MCIGVDCDCVVFVGSVFGCGVFVDCDVVVVIV